MIKLEYLDQIPEVVKNFKPLTQARLAGSRLQSFVAGDAGGRV